MNGLRSVVLRCVVLILLSAFLAAPALAADRPNIVLIFVDDMGYGDLGCYGNKVHQTPNIDRLAAEGQRWTSFYSAGATCVPSRRGLMTGRHPALMGRADLVAARGRLMPAVLKQCGYATAILGKWHLAGYPKDFTKSPMHPLECGFDHHFGTPGSNDVPAPKGKVQNREVFDTCDKFTFQVPLIRGREVVEFPANQELFTSRYTAEAVQWIEKNKDGPFFLYLAHNMPHAPVFASEKFQGKSRGGRFGDVVEEIDWSVGQIMKAVKDAGIDERTLIVFTSDNGPWSMFGPHGGSAGPLRGEKGTSWEGGYRVPGIFRWPGKIKPGVIDGMGANLDLYSTFAKLASGSEPPGDATRQVGFNSLDLSDTLLGAKPARRKQWLYSSGGAVAFRSGRFKIHLSTKDRSSNPNTRKREPLAHHDPPLLFDLSQDLGEQHSITADHPEVVSRLVEELARFRKQPPRVVKAPPEAARIKAMERIADFALAPPKLNTSPLPDYDYDQLDYGMTIGIERTPAGRLWACWVAGGDSPAAFFVLATSDDDGESWSKPRLVVDAHDDRLPAERSVLVGNLWTDPLGRLWLIFDQSMDMFDGRAGVWVAVCENPDAEKPKWSRPRRIWHGVTLNKPTVLSSGEWMLPISLDQRPGFREFKGCFRNLDPLRGANVFVSNDQGETWQRRGCVRFPNPDWHEHMIVERKGGALWMLARTGKGIMQSTSTDHGKTWSEPSFPAIKHPVARFHVRRLASGRILLVKHGKSIDTHAGRSMLTAWLSEDEGRTWQGGLMLDERKGISYPDGFQEPGGLIYISYDRNRSTDGEILLARFTEDDILAKKLVGPKSKLKMLISRPLAIAKEKP